MLTATFLALKLLMLNPCGMVDRCDPDSCGETDEGGYVYALCMVAQGDPDGMPDVYESVYGTGMPVKVQF